MNENSLEENMRKALSKGFSFLPEELGSHTTIPENQLQHSKVLFE